MGSGQPAFYISLFMIGLVTMVVGEFATLFGCSLGIPQPVTAITFVALGTSLPDTFASMTAARSSKFADSAVGNITGSNSVNVFLGLGLPWTYATIYKWAYYNENHAKPAGQLTFSVTMFLCTSLVCFAILFLRRRYLGGELGGPAKVKYLSSAILIGLWLFYIVMCILKNFKVEGL